MIRQFRTEDAPGCVRVIQACVERDPQISAALRQKLLRSESPEKMLRRASLFYVAVFDSDEGAWGVAGLDLNEIRLLYVVPEHQGEGIGGALLSHLESMIPPAVFTDIFVYSTFAAVDFYRARGYTSGGEFTFDIDGESLTAVFMTKALR